MHDHERKLTDSTSPSSRPGVDPDFAHGPSGQGDFAAGLRICEPAAEAYGTIARGMSRPLAQSARTVGDFAAGCRSNAGAPATGDFARGMRVRDRGQARLGGGRRSPSDREHEKAG